MADLLVRGTCDHRRFSDSTYPSTTAGIAFIDLSQIQFAYPVAVVGIGVFVQRSLANGYEVRIRALAHLSGFSSEG